MQRLDNVHKLVKQAYSHLQALGPNEMIPSHLVNTVNECDRTLREIHLDSAGIDLPGPKRTMFKTTMEITGDLIRKTRLIAVQSKPRPQPVFIMLHGEPMQGKSEFASALPRLVLQKIAVLCAERRIKNPFDSVDGAQSMKRYPEHLS